MTMAERVRASIWHARRRALASALAAAAFSLVPTAGTLPAAQAQPAATAPHAPSQGVAVNLNVTPKRLILDRGNRAGTVYIFNQGNVPATFDIALVERVMLPSGEIRSLAEARSQPELQPIAGALASAQSMLIAAPRRVTLAPGRGQTIRVRVTQPPKGAGEHRTHLTVTTIPPRDAGVTAEQVQSQQTGQLSFKITSVFGLSIPVIVRSSSVDARGAIENVRVAYANISPDGLAAPVRTPVLRFDVRRLGANSLFGNIEVRASRAGDRAPLGLARGVGIYPEINHRAIQIPLRRVPAAGEQLQVVFIDDDSSPGRVIAKFAFTVP